MTDGTCPNCGQPLITECLTVIPPQYRERCLSCGWISVERRLSAYATEPEQVPEGPKVIKSGKSQFTMVCSRCGCEFMYSLRDLDCVDFVYCPECHERHKHPNQAISNGPDWWTYIVNKTLNDSIDPYTGQFRKTTDLPRVFEDYAGPKGTTTANTEGDHAAKD